MYLKINNISTNSTLCAFKKTFYSKEFVSIDSNGSFLVNTVSLHILVYNAVTDVHCNDAVLITKCRQTTLHANYPV